MNGVRRLPALPGIYLMRDGDSRVVYLGRTVNLRSRVASYWAAPPSPPRPAQRPHLRGLLERVRWVDAVITRSPHEAALLERQLLALRLPDFNRTVGGQETEVWIELDASSRAAHLTVRREPPRACAPLVFGPYLGSAAAQSLSAVL